MIGRQRRGTLPHRCLEYVTQWSSNFEILFREVVTTRVFTLLLVAKKSRRCTNQNYYIQTKIAVAVESRFSILFLFYRFGAMYMIVVVVGFVSRMNSILLTTFNPNLFVFE